MESVVIIDSESPELTVLTDQISSQLAVKVTRVETVEAAKDLPTPSAVILSLPLSINNYTPLEGVPTVLISGNLPLQSRQFLLAKKLLDTVANYSQHNCRYIISLLKRIDLLRQTKVLVCEGEKLTQTLIARNLTTLGVDVITCDSLGEVKKKMARPNDIRLVMVSSHLGKSPGLEVVEHLRNRYNKLDLPIIALMDESDSEEFEIEFLRHGATASIVKKISTPLSMEQFRSQVMQTLRQVINYFEMSRMAERDSLTGAFNRRHFFDAGEGLFANYQRGNIFLAVAMLDIDDFKKVNDTYGHPAGDLAIISMAKQLERAVRKTDIVSRFGGEEFCVILSGTDAENALAVMERIRTAIESEIHSTETGDTFSYTVSIGITVQKAETLEKMVNKSDKLLYKAKSSGKNCVVSDII
jgi:diguanylate cyclase (GGDEF)-like protein